uniref:Uncharacterized protein n=1 Tax=Solanum tuberosum TaxID=4113 RepID=M1DD26_SOLTU
MAEKNMPEVAVKKPKKEIDDATIFSGRLKDGDEKITLLVYFWDYDIAPSHGLRPPSRPVKGTTGRGGARGPLTSGPHKHGKTPLRLRTFLGSLWGLLPHKPRLAPRLVVANTGREDPRGHGEQWLSVFLAALAP